MPVVEVKGTGYLGGTAYARNARLNAEIRIANLMSQRDSASSKLAKEEHDRIVGTAYGSIASMLVQNQIDGVVTTLEDAKPYLDA